MSTRKTSKRRLKKYAVGDMRERVTIHVRSLTAPAFSSPSNFTETYDTGTRVWAFVANVSLVGSGRQEFDSINIILRSTHKMVIRYRGNITTENVIRWRGEAYKILKIIDPEERHQYLELYCNVLGDKTLEANT